jgi:Ca2+-binding RTX toxin-like protein
MAKTRATPLRSFHQFEERVVPAVIANYLTDVLSVTGDGQANNIQVSADANGNLVVTNNGQAIKINVVSGMPVKGSLKTVVVDAKGGNDVIGLDRSLNTLDAAGRLAFSPNASLSGGTGADAITPLIGGFVGGVVGAPIVGNTVMDGGDGNDTLTSGFGNDVMIGGDGNDTLIWLPGTLLDVYEGGAGTDNGVIVGNDNNQGDNFVLSQNPTAAGRVLFQRTNLVPFFVDMDDVETVTMRTQSGDDNIVVNDMTGTDVQMVVSDGGIGNDSIDGSLANVRQLILGGDGNDKLAGGSRQDTISGGMGDDFLFGNDGADTLNGDAGNDSLDGGRGADTLLGGDGNDVLSGGADTAIDTLVGGNGKDTFVQYVNDTFVDFNPAEGDITVLPPL